MADSIDSITGGQIDSSVDTISQEFVDNLITVIWNAEDPESVTNEMVARIFDHLNTGYKNLLTNNEAVKNEKAERVAADEAIRNTINTLQLALTTVQKTAEDAKSNSTTNSSILSNLIGRNASQAIENFNEILSFLDGIKDNDSLVALLSSLGQRITNIESSAGELSDKDMQQDERLDTLEETSVKALSADSIDGVVDSGVYFVTLSGDKGTVLIVRTRKLGSGISTSYETIQYLFDTTGLTYRKASYLPMIIGAIPPWGEWEQVGQKGAGNLINITELVPPENGFYDLASAIEAVPNTHRALGRWITYRLGTGEWETKQFTGSTLSQWESTAAWVEVGGKGSITGIQLNGETITPDADGVVNVLIDQIEVDDTLDPNSTNPVQNNVVTQAINEQKSKIVADIDAQLNDEGTEVHIALLNADRQEFAGCDFPVGSSTGGEDVNTSKIILSAVVDNPVIRSGSPVKLYISYDHQYLGGDQSGESTGQQADIEITIKNGAVTTFSTTLSNVSPGNLEPIDITGYVRTGTTTITVRASAADPENGVIRTRQTTAQVVAMTLSLSSSYNLANTIVNGGYGPSDTATIPFTISGSGSKTISLYLDGVVYDTKVVTKSGKTNGSFVISMADLTVGRHNVQMVAEVDASETLTLRSESIFIDILKTDASIKAPTSFIGLMVVFSDGRIFDNDDYIRPCIEVGQFEQLSFDFVVYDPDITPAEMQIYHNGIAYQTISAARTVQTYNNRYTDYGVEEMIFKTGDIEYYIDINVVESSIDLVEATDSLRLKLSASGRSNAEENPGIWTYGDIDTTFDGFDWSTNGWTGDALRLTNGAGIVINDTPFASDATAQGFTIEAEIMCSNVSDRSGTVMECMSEGVGFRMTTEQAMMVVSGGYEIETKFAPDVPIKVAFVVESKNQNRLLHLYVNGIRDRALQYPSTASLIHVMPTKISVISESADVELRNIRVYNRALTDDEILSNYIVDRQTTDEMVALFDNNAVLNDETDEVDIDKLRAQGKAVMRIVGDVDLVNKTNNKKFEIKADVYFYSQYGKEYDFVARNIGLRIQGTSSTTYPRKNYRIYFDRPDYGCSLEVNGVNVPSMCYAFKPGARPVPIFCLKADFSDSSSTHNTGSVKIIDDVYRRCGWLTPPQQAYEGDYDVRVGVDGFPMNLFYDNNGEGVAKFLGKYNFNNEKSESGIVYGFEGIEGYNDEATLAGQRNKCVCLEFLNNSAPLCLFTTADMSGFDDEQLEFRFKEGDSWADAHDDDKTAVSRLWSWILSCKGNPDKFLKEYNSYFGNDAPFVWYALTNYFMAVDNRAKNMMFVTWDGLLWYIIPYDMDTIWGERNDSHLKFDYTIDYDSYDASQGAYCFAGHDSVLWDLVRGCPDHLAEVARKIRTNMTTEYVLDVFNNQFMNQWSERIYNKDGEYKYITPLIEEGKDYLFALQGARYAHRTYTIVNRFALLDSEYCAGTYRDDAFPIYLSYNFGADPRDMKIVAAERFYFGYGMTNGDPTVSGLKASEQGDEIIMTFDKNLIVNDPQNIYGASRIEELDLTDLSHAIVGTLNLNKCLRLNKLYLSCSSISNTLTNLVVEKCRNLNYLDVEGQTGLSTLDLSGNIKLVEFNGYHTELTNIVFARGAKLRKIFLPSTIRTLELRYMSDLDNNGIDFEYIPDVTRLVVDNCKNIDWEALLTACPATIYLRVTGINATGNGDMLRKFLSMKGVDENGNNVNTCRLVGIYQLTNYLEDKEYNEIVSHFPELNILQPEWTVVKYDESVSDPKNISNLDNNTGYDYDNEYKPSGHISKILAARHRVMAKYTAEGVMTVCPLDDSDSRKYHDGTEANLEGFNHTTKADEGDVMMYEPSRWCKGIDDFINHTHYHCFSSLESVSTPEGVKLFADDMVLRDKTACRVSASYATLDECATADEDYRVFIADVQGYIQVRWPAVNSTIYGAVFLDVDNNIVGRVYASSGRMKEDSYLFTNVPTGAVKIAFTCVRNFQFTFAWLTHSDRLEDIEPDAWNTGEYLCGVNKAYYGNLQIRSINGVTPTVNTARNQFDEYCKKRGVGFSLITYAMHRDIACLFWATYGNRDSSGVCGYGSGSTTSITGLTAFLGMTDTIRNTAASVGADGGWYYNDSYVLTKVASINALGYENLWGNIFELVDDVQVDYGVWVITEQNVTRKVEAALIGKSWIVEVHNGRYMDVVPTSANGSSSTYYADIWEYSNSAARVVRRSHSSAASDGGVSYAYAVYDASNPPSHTGSRLAFSGKIEYTLNVAAFLAAQQIS